MAGSRHSSVNALNAPEMNTQKWLRWDFPGGLVVNTSLSNAGGIGPAPDLGANIPKCLITKTPKHFKKKKKRSNPITNSIKT